MNKTKKKLISKMKQTTRNIGVAFVTFSSTKMVYEVKKMDIRSLV
jgi:hypothetical protein